ncbi:MAG: RhsIA family immunity protein [Planctomycetaceae bacterium]|jgi:hypothetical protein|nr:RhsIA family immunity protein [Planctomycetaceae bacterium]
MQTPREIVESFISDMVKVYIKHIDLIHETRRESDTIDKDPLYCNLSYPPQEWRDRCRAALSKHRETLRTYKIAQGVVVESYSITLPQDYFLSASSGCQYIGDEIIREEIVNENKIKIYTKSNCEGYNYYRLKVFTLQKKDDNWQIVKLRRIDETTGKEEGMAW